MRKLPLFSTVLSLFLLVPASITRAQVTKTLNGTVRYESGMSETKFSTPNGDVKVNLPQSLSGAMISGTVSTEPAGKTEKEKKRNLNELLKYVVNLNGTKIPLTVKPANFDWSASVDKPLRNPLELINASGVKVAEVSLPPVLSAPAPMGGWGSNAGPVLGTPSKILVKGDALNVYTNQQFSPGEKFVLTDSKGQQFTLTPICLSSEQAVMNVPEGVMPGNCTVREEASNQPVSGNSAGAAGFELIDINLSSPNTNLRNGQTSSVTLTIDKRVPAEIDSNEFMVFSVDIKNLTPSVVDMAGGNIQMMSFPINGDHKSSSAWQLTRTITGIKPGNFSVSATLHEDYTTSNDPFRPQLNVLKTPEDFNAWADALKKDLKEYATMEKHSDGNGDYLINLFQAGIRANTQRAINNMPVSTKAEQLDESKAVAYSLLRPLNIPKAVTNFWISGLESYKAAIKTVPSFLSGNPQLIDYEVIKKGLAYADKMGKVLGYDLRNGSADAGKIVTQIQTEGETKENLKKLDGTLIVLNARITKALNEMPVVSKMLLPGGILFATKFTPPGTAKAEAEITDITWDISQFKATKGKDALVVEYHFTGDITVKEISIRVNWVDKNGKTGVADAIAKVDKDNEYKNCDKLPVWVIWPDDFKPAGMDAPPEKDKLDLGKDKDGNDKFKAKAFVNGKPVGGGTPGNNPK